MRFPLLPKWALTNKLPAFYDWESLTAVDQTARLYGTIQGLLDDYNKFADEINKAIEEFEKGIISDQECFKNKLTKIMHDYIAMIDEKLLKQDEKINQAILYLNDNIADAVTQEIEKMKEEGLIDQAVLDAIDGIGSRVATLETTITNHTTAIEELNIKILNLENTKPRLIYNAETESLNFENVEVVTYE